jgi:hypothetical protein
MRPAAREVVFATQAEQISAARIKTDRSNTVSDISVGIDSKKRI